jgi:hypothetical protein
MGWVDGGMDRFSIELDDGSRARYIDISIFRKNVPTDGRLSRDDFVCRRDRRRRRAEISGSIKKEGKSGREGLGRGEEGRRRPLEAAGGEKKVVRVGTRRESCDLRSRRKPRVLHIRRMMSFVSSLRRPVALNSSYLEFQEDRPTYGDDINTRERYGGEGGGAAPYLARYHCGALAWCSATSTLPAKTFGRLFLKSFAGSP